MARQELLTLEHAEACAGCGAELGPGVRAWRDAEAHLWTCTDCLPPDESTRHSLAHGFVRPDRSYSGLF
ncbi:MAG: hypothetical protein HOQ28_03940 [Thermoleophilia bacterium]|nr:hypothetical protein [Thermoleophilia bacterium]